MAFSNFKSVIWSKFIQTELEKKCRLVEDCWTQFEGEAKQGARVKIIGVGAPDIFDYVPGNGIPAPWRWRVQAFTLTSTRQRHSIL